jgi:serine/threonine protein kinase
VDPERWRQVGELFHRALEHDAKERSRFLDEACAGNPALRAEVDSLLAHHDDGAPPVVPTPPEVAPTPPEVAPTPPEDAAAASDAGGAGLTAGRRLGPYRIMRKLGEGGMGVVHLAEDTRLGRRVAIKALPPRFTRDERRRRRLRREARAAASLTHPGIATVYALEEFDGALCIVSEYVAGETLRQELAAGPLPPADLLDTATAIARALAAAHEGNVLHRDLKPENVIRIQATGIEDAGVKIVDFGLARFGDPEAGAASATQLTAPGAMLGTPGYMAPEQIRGEPIDFRADIFAFGVLLFELATGSHPFTSATPVSTVARVLESTPPDLRQLAPACPAALAAVIGRCLQKDPAQRYAATRELVEDLEDARRTPAESPAAPPNGGAPPGDHDHERAQRPSPTDGAGRSSHDPERRQRSSPTDRAARGSHDHERGRRPSPADGAARGLDPERGRRSSSPDEAARGSDERERGMRLSPVWWWQFHQRAAGVVYYAMLYPLWRVREWAPPPWGPAVFFAALAAVLVAANLRFHLSFTERFTPDELHLQQTRVAPWVRAADWLFVALLLAATALIAAAHPAWASLTAAVGIVSAVTFLVIEPATTRAAFRDRP